MYSMTETPITREYHVQQDFSDGMDNQNEAPDGHYRLPKHGGTPSDMRGLSLSEPRHETCTASECELVDCGVESESQIRLRTKGVTRAVRNLAEADHNCQDDVVLPSRYHREKRDRARRGAGIRREEGIYQSG